MVLYVVDPFQKSHFNILDYELWRGGLRLNQPIPQVFITRTNRGGIVVRSTVKQTNLTEEEIQEIRDNGEDHQEVFEHWLCSNWLIEKLKQQDEPILETDLGAWWGRTCTGQAINLDYNVQELAYQYSHDERLYKKKVA